MSGDNTAASGPAVAILSPCGYGNLGDAAILDSVVAAVRRRLGAGAGIVGFTLNPDDTAARHGIDAHPILGFSRPFYPVRERGGERRRFGPAAEERDWMSLVPPLRKLRTLGAMVAAELAHERACRSRLAGCRFVIVAGGGQLDEYWGGPMGHPFALWRWSALARQLGARFVVLSVGTGKLVTGLGRRLARATLAAADYRSFRDQGSRELMERDGRLPVSSIVPDLAYAVPRPARAERASRAGARPLVAVSPISYRDPRGWPDKDSAAYGQHVRTMAAFVARLLAEDLDVRFFASEHSDWATVADVRAALPAPADRAGAARAEVAPTDGVRQLLDFVGGADLVVACRLHAALLSHVAGTPVVALSYERKVAALMRDTGQDAYCLSIDSLQVEEAVRLVKRAIAERPALAATVGDRVAGFRARVEQQYDDVFGAHAATP